MLMNLRYFQYCHRVLVSVLLKVLTPSFTPGSQRRKYKLEHGQNTGAHWYSSSPYVAYVEIYQRFGQRTFFRTS